MQTLFANTLQPITSRFAFIKSDIQSISDFFSNWQNSILKESNNTINKNTIKDNLYDTLLRLLPLSSAEMRRYLLIPTNSEWVAFFDNGHMGTDPSAPCVIGENLKSDVIYLSYNSVTKEISFEYYADNIENNYSLLRSIYISNEKSRRFYEYGKPLPFEDVSLYKSRKINDKFNIDILEKYLTSINIDAFNIEFYRPEAGSLFFSKNGPLFALTRLYSIEDAKKFNGY